MGPEMERKVFEMAARGETSRQIAAILAKDHGLSVSHTTVLAVIARVRQEREEVADAAFSSAEDSDGTQEPIDRLRRMSRSMRELSARATRVGQLSVALRALDRELVVLRLVLAEERAARRNGTHSSPVAAPEVL
jgi:hypothetical protein